MLHHFYFSIYFNFVENNVYLIKLYLFFYETLDYKLLMMDNITYIF